MNRKPAVVIFRPRGPRSKSDTPSAFSSATTRRLTAVCRTPSSRAAPLKLRWSATLSAQPIDIGLIAADSVIPLGEDLFRGMTKLLGLTRSTEPIDWELGQRRTGAKLWFSKPRRFDCRHRNA